MGAVMAVALGVSGLAALVLAPSPVSASSPPDTPFTECPPIGHDTGCQILLVINADGTVSVYQDHSQHAYEGNEDSLVGVLNNDPNAVSGLQITGPKNTFNFDGDGICDPGNPNSPFSPGADCSTNHTDTTGYGGPESYFTGINLLRSSGNVLFQAPLASSGSTYFSLEGVLAAADITGTIVPPTTGNVTDASALALPAGLNENTAFNGSVAKFKSSVSGEASTDFSATVDFGDGTGPVTATISGPNGDGFYHVSASHTYADELSGGTLSVTITGPNNTVTVSEAANVGEADTLAATGPSASFNINTGDTASGTIASFTDTGYPGNDAGDFSATINWGDGSGNLPGTVTKTGPGAFSVSGSHTYTSAGSYSITVTLKDNSPGTATATATGGTATVTTPGITCATGATVYTGHISGNIIAIGPVCIINAKVDGNVIVAPSSSLQVLSSKIGGNIITLATTFQVCDTHVTGNVLSYGTTTPQLGTGPGCAPDHIGGNVIL
ncbi:MAG: hypothetical protein ACRDX8_13445 [Acidimicrobiales bacterium]